MTQTQAFQADVGRVLELVVHSLYSQPEIFLRELISNSSDALDKLRFRGLSEPALLEGGFGNRIRLRPDRAGKCLHLEDDGVGMTAEELAKNLGTIAWSGSRDFLAQLEAAKASERPGLIGQFGVGFYSGYLVADRVEVVSRAAGTDVAHRWSSDGKTGFIVEPAERANRGTTITLHLKAEHEGLLEEWKLRELVRRYSDYVEHPIELEVTRTKDGNVDSSWEVVNQGKAIWLRSPKEVEPAQYEDFYRHVSRDFEKPLAHKHFRVEGTQQFAGIIYVPSKRPFDLFDPDGKHGVRLHVQRVMVLEHAEELVPRWLRFLKGVVDSEDLPLNVSRELLQDSRATKIIRKTVVKEALELLDNLAEDPGKYREFWDAFGAVLKEALVVEPEQKDRVAKLLRYASTASTDGLTSLDGYVERMKPEQSAIYFLTGNDRAALENGPHLEALRKRGYEVLLMTDPVDPFALDSFHEFAGKPLVSAARAKLDELTEDPAETAKKEAAAGWLGKVKELLGARVADVRASTRLTDSPACLVESEESMAPHVERLMRARGMELPPSKRVLELNLDHPAVTALARLTDAEDAAKLERWVELLHGQALLAEGGLPEDPAAFARRLSELLVSAAG